MSSVAHCRTFQVAIVASVLVLAGQTFGQQATTAPSAEVGAMVENVLNPFWRSTTMTGEGLFFTERKEGEPACATLLFPPEKILSLKSATGETVYEEGKDYALDKTIGVISLLPGSRIPWKTLKQLQGLSGEGTLFHKLQVEATYTHKEGLWTGYTAKFSGEGLPNTMKKLRGKEPVKLCLSGDSISQGYNASGFTKAPPYMPCYGELVALGLEKAWGSKVTFCNFAVAGWTSGNGVADVAKVAAEKPDLVMIAYGMNDSNVKAFAANIKTLMAKVQETSPNTEFVLVSPMLRSPQQSFDGFRDELARLCGTGAVLADMTSVWGEMFKRKSFHDLTGNGINHPNDFGHRLYAQVILALLVKPAQ